MAWPHHTILQSVHAVELVLESDTILQSVYAVELALESGLNSIGMYVGCSISGSDVYGRNDKNARNLNFVDRPYITSPE
jgi:uncharacterized protein (UPF0297 family)